MNPESLIAKKVKEVPPSGIRRFFEIASEMTDVISLGVGEPDFVTPWNVREASIYSIEKGHTHYTSNWGLLELRQEIARYLSTRFSLSYDPEREILLTIGASEAIDLALRAIIEPGDEVLIPEPSYVSYMPTVTFAGGNPIALRIRPEDGFKLKPEALQKQLTGRTKALIMPYPNNPTGAVMDETDLQGIAAVLRNSNALVISDEIYAELTYAGRHVSIASLPNMKERTILINGFSKAFAMTGWRMGYAAGHPALIGAMVKIHQYTILCAPIMNQMAALEALKSGFETDYAEVQKMVRQYNRRRRILVDAFNRMGLDCFEPLGAFYVFPCIGSTGLSSQEFCERLLKVERVAAIPGTAFGPSGEGFIRCSYAASEESIIEATKRIEAFVSSLKGQSICPATGPQNL